MKKEYWKEYIDFAEPLTELPHAGISIPKQQQDTITIEKVIQENEKLKRQYADLQSDYAILLEKYNKLVADF